MVKTQSTGAGKRSVKRPPVRAVKATASRNRSGFMLFLRRRKLLLLTLLGLKLLAVGVLVWMHVHYHNQQRAAERAADVAYFAQLEARMNRDFGDYARSLNPTSFETSRSCSRVSLKFQEGQLSCGVTLHVSFKDLQAADSERQFSLLRAQLRSRGYEFFEQGLAYPDNSAGLKRIDLKEHGMDHCSFSFRSTESNEDLAGYYFGCYSNSSNKVYASE